MEAGKQCSAFSQLLELLEFQRHHRPDFPAIASVDGVAFTYRRLAEQARRTRASLREAGVGPQDAVALVLPDGPFMAAACVTVATAAAIAPLNPTYTAAEFELFFDQLCVRAVVVPQGASGEAVQAARGRGLTVIELIEGCDGGFLLRPDRVRQPAWDSELTPDATAVLLHAPDATARPKIVPLTHADLCASARNIADSRQLTDTDRCLTLTPMFHADGLIGALLSTLASGGTVVCALLGSQGH